jgi:hypothetical protein
MAVGNTSAAIRGVYKENIIIDPTSGIVREAKFTFPNENNHSFTHFFNFGDFSVFHGERFSNKESLPAPVYYLNNKLEKVVT